MDAFEHPGARLTIISVRRQFAYLEHLGASYTKYGHFRYPFRYLPILLGIPVPDLLLRVTRCPSRCDKHPGARLPLNSYGHPGARLTNNYRHPGAPYNATRSHMHPGALLSIVTRNPVPVWVLKHPGARLWLWATWPHTACFSSAQFNVNCRKQFKRMHHLASHQAQGVTCTHPR